MTKKQNQGFTLIELLMVISIIGLLTSIVLSSMADAKAKARDTARIKAMIETRTALQMYFSDKGYYPDKNLTTKLTPTYIPAVSNEIIYSGTKAVGGLGSICGVSDLTCVGYQMAILLEKNNSVLSSDADLNNIIKGNSTNCGAGTGADLCYDLVQ